MTSRRSWATILSSAALVVSLTGQLASGGAPTQGGVSVWDGVYTAAQADRGRAVYESHCSRCHGEAAASRENPLSGERFADHWEARTLADRKSVV